MFILKKEDILKKYYYNKIGIRLNLNILENRKCNSFHVFNTGIRFDNIILNKEVI